MSRRVFEDPLFDAVMKASYHGDRAAFFETTAKILDYTLIVCGASALLPFLDRMSTTDRLSYSSF